MSGGAQARPLHAAVRQEFCAAGEMDAFDNSREDLIAPRQR